MHPLILHRYVHHNQKIKKTKEENFTCLKKRFYFFVHGFPQEKKLSKGGTARKKIKMKFSKKYFFSDLSMKFNDSSRFFILFKKRQETTFPIDGTPLKKNFDFEKFWH